MEIDICPRWIPAKFRVSERGEPHLGMVFSPLLIVALLPVAIHIPHFCLVRKVFGIGRVARRACFHA
jgi:hypothetical protein